VSKYGSPDLSISIDNDSGTPVDLTDYIDEIGDVTVEALIAETTVFGDSYVKQTAVGLSQMPEFTIAGYYDDTATTGPDAVLNSPGDTRTVTITWGESKTTGFDVIIKTYTRKPVKGELHRYECGVVPTGTITEDA